MGGDGTKLSSLELKFDRSIYEIEAVKRAAYVLMPRLRTDIRLTQNEIICTLAATDGSVDVESARTHFQREVLDQDLRLRLEADTEPMRSAILGLAFSRTGLQDD